MTGTTFPPYDGGHGEGNGGYGGNRYDHQNGGQQQQHQQQHNHHQHSGQQHQQENQSTTGSSGRTDWGNNPGNDAGGQAGQWKGNSSNGGNNSNGNWKSGNNSSGGNGGWQNKQGGGGGGGWQNKQGGGGGWQNKQGGGGGKQWERPKETDMTMYKPYVVVANPDMPAEIVSRFQEAAMMLENHGYTVRVGGMAGIDEAIEKTVKKIEVHLPWRGFGEKESKFYFNTDRAFAVAKQFHPAYDTLKKSIQAFLAKNARLVMGDKMISPALFMLCWTEDGCESLRARNSRTGFTGHPIAIASALGIPIFNLANPDALQRLNFLVESCNEQIQN